MSRLTLAATITRLWFVEQKETLRREKFFFFRPIIDVLVIFTCTFEPVENYPSETAPYYLIAEKKLTRDIPKGTIITKDMVDLSSSDLYRMMNSVK